MSSFHQYVESTTNHTNYGAHCLAAYSTGGYRRKVNGRESCYQTQRIWVLR